MRFTTSAIISLALVLSASASPIAANDPGVVVDTYADPVEKRDDGLICLNRGPEVSSNPLLQVKRRQLNV